MALCAIILGTAITPITSTSTAHAATEGAGIAFPDLWLGQYVTEVDGKIAYCIEVYRPTPYGAKELPAEDLVTLPGFDSPGGTISHPEMSGEALRHLNYVLTRYGATSNNEEAAAVQFAIWILRAGNASSGTLDIIQDILVDNGRTDLLNRGQAIANEARNFDYAGAASHASPPQIDMSDPYKGTLTVSPGTTEVTLSQAVFVDTGEKKRVFSESGIAEAQTFTITGVPNFVEGSWDRHYEVSVTGKYRYEVIPKKVTVYRMDHGLQKLIAEPASGAEKRTGSFEAQTARVDTRWKPVLTTETPVKKVAKGEHFSDSVAFSVAEDSAPWRHAVRDGERTYAPITATGTLYGPFLSDPAKNPSQEPPVGAPIAAQATVTTDEHAGPGTVEVQTEEVSREAGYYTWQWEIDIHDQAESVQSPEANSGTGASGTPSLPDNYRFMDGFGVAEEGQYTDMEIELDTELSDSEVVLGDTLTDTVTVSLASRGGWLQGEDGNRIPITLHGELYQTETKPTQQTGVPSHAKKLVDFAPVTVNGPDDSVQSEPVAIPLTSSGWVTALWCVREEDQPENIRGLVKETCDDFGVPAETAQVLRPEVTTKAVPNATVFEEIHDVAEVSGHLPKTDTRIVFNAYLTPQAGHVKYDENWTPVTTDGGAALRWEDSDFAQIQDTCDVQPVAQTEPVPVTETGDIHSPEITAKSVGTVYWVEELQAQAQNSEEWVTLHRGECGLPNETTEILTPKVTTKAVPNATPGDKIYDTAHVDGPLISPEGGHWELSFEAFLKPKQDQSRNTTADNQMPNDTENQAEWCTNETKVWESAQAETIIKTGDYQSESFMVEHKHLGDVFWIETLRWKSEDFGYQHEHRGMCGAKNEITVVSEGPVPAPPKPDTPTQAPLADTGTAHEHTQLIIWIAIAAVVAGGISIVAVNRRHRNKNNDSEVIEP